MLSIITEHATEIGTVMGAGFLYVVAELAKWFKSRKSNIEVKSNVAEILEGQKAFHDNINNEVASIKNDMAAVKKELTYNGGSSLKDQINEMKGLQEARFFTQQNQNPTPLYNCNKMGECTFSNTALAELFGMHYTEMLGKGWLAAIGETQVERENVYEEWINSVRNDLPFEREYTVVNQKTKEKILCRSKAEAQRKKDGEVMFYLGTVQKIS